MSGTPPLRPGRHAAGWHACHPPSVLRCRTSAHCDGARSGRRGCDRNQPWRRARGIELQLRLQRAHRSRVDRGGRRERDAREDHRPAAAGHRHDRRSRRRARRGCAVGAHRHAFDRSRHREAAHRARAQAGHGRRRVSDDGAHDAARRAGAAGEADGILRRALRATSSILPARC